MQKRALKVSLDAQVDERLTRIAERYGLTSNTLLAAAGYELSRVQPENLWHALGRIAAGEGAELVTNDQETLPAARKAPKRALPA